MTRLLEPRALKPHKSGVEIITFGCRLNAYESEVIRRHATDAGLEDALIVNTCAVTKDAERPPRQPIPPARRPPHTAPLLVPCAAAPLIPAALAAPIVLWDIVHGRFAFFGAGASHVVPTTIETRNHGTGQASAHRRQE